MYVYETVAGSIPRVKSDPRCYACASVKPQRAFDYYIRSLTSSLLVLGIAAVVLYDGLSDRPISTALQSAWTLIVGVYVGSHVTINGRRPPPEPPDDH